MKNTAVETVLHMDDFTDYFEATRLGELYFPNGKAYVHPGGSGFGLSSIRPFYIDLADLYKLVTGWKVNHTLVPLDDIVAVIAFGSAVRHPGVQEVTHERRKYLLFGEKVTKVKQVPIQPNVADFLVITSTDLMREEELEPILFHTEDCGTWIEKGGVHVLSRGVRQLLESVRAHDMVSVSALREGVPVFFDDRLGTVFWQGGVASATPRKILWDENDEGCLTGRIQ